MRKWDSNWTKRTCGSENLPQLCSFPSLIKFLTCKCSTVKPDILHLARELCSSGGNGNGRQNFVIYAITPVLRLDSLAWPLPLFWTCFPLFSTTSLFYWDYPPHMHCKCCITHDSLAHTVDVLVCPIPNVSFIQCLSPPIWQTPSLSINWFLRQHKEHWHNLDMGEICPGVMQWTCLAGVHTLWVVVWVYTGGIVCILWMHLPGPRL